MKMALPAGYRQAVSALAAAASDLFQDGPLLTRKMQSLRPYICPFDRLLELIPAGARVLDIGCGAGLLLGLLARQRPVGPSCGIDPSARAIQLANLMLRRLPPEAQERIRFELRDPGQPLPESRFDVVSLVDVVHHIEPAQQQAFLVEAARKVGAGDMLLYKDISPRPLLQAWMNRLHDLIVSRQWVHYLRGEQVCDWLKDAGLVPIRREIIYRLWYAHELIVFRREE